MKKRSSFWELLVLESDKSKYIEIPTIQRDYAQGRDTPTANRVIDSFLKALINALKKNQPLHLDFIYGKSYTIGGRAQEEAEQKSLKELFNSLNRYTQTLGLKSAIDITQLFSNKSEQHQTHQYLIPLDGQQRLTTLFLLHWYLLYKIYKDEDLRKDQDDKESPFETLQRFIYRTRASSQEFIQFICSEDTQEKLRESKREYSPLTLAERIQSLPKFFSEWEYDPTVKGMLRVIDKLSEQLSNTSTDQLKKFWKRLTEEPQSPIIYFDYLNIDDLKQTDELYVKMNARGRQLNEWENFKVWLIETFSKEDFTTKELKELSIKIDIEWHDLFWKARLETDEIDAVGDAYLQFFKLQFLFIYLKEGDNESINPSTVNILRAREQGDFIEILEHYFSKNPKRKTEYLQTIRTILDELSGDNLKGVNRLNRETADTYQLYIQSTTADSPASKIDSFCNYFFSKRSLDLNLSATALLYAITHKIEKQTKGKWIDELERYTQVIGNLIYNTTIDNFKELAHTIKSIDSLIESICNDTQYSTINDYFASDAFYSLPFFNGKQKSEEQTKAKMLINNPQWLPLFREAESIPYFYGQIGFILYYLESKQELTLASFHFYYERLKLLFSDKILNHKEYLFQRALLTKGTYLLSLRSNLSFLENDYGTLRRRNENWRILFSNKEKLNYLMSLVEDPNLSVEQIEESLRVIINNYINRLKVSDQLKRLDLFILEPTLIAQCQRSDFRVWNENIYLLNSTRISGYYKELHTTYLYIQLKESLSKKEKKNMKISYKDSKGERDREPYVALEIDGRTLSIERERQSGEFIICDEGVKLHSFPNEKSLKLYQRILEYINNLIS